jgi:hypothetical protein
VRSSPGGTTRSLGDLVCRRRNGARLTCHSHEAKSLTSKRSSFSFWGQVPHHG